MAKFISKQFWRLHRHLFGKGFSKKGYLEANPDVKKTQMDPWKHYVLYGKKEGRSLYLNKKESKCVHDRFFLYTNEYLKNIEHHLV